MIERQIEHYLALSCCKIGALCFKLTSPSNAGVPDRFLAYNGRVVFVEVKRPGGKPRQLQVEVAKRLREAGCHVYCLSTKEQVTEFIKDLQHGYPDPNAYDEI